MLSWLHCHRVYVCLQALSRLEGSLSALWTPVETSPRRSPTLLDSKLSLQPCLQVGQSVMLPRLLLLNMDWYKL